MDLCERFRIVDFANESCCFAGLGSIRKDECFAPLPTNRSVEFTATYQGESDGRFTVEATAQLEGKLLAFASATFTEVTLETFGSVESQ